MKCYDKIGHHTLIKILTKNQSNTFRYILFIIIISQCMLINSYKYLVIMQNLQNELLNILPNYLYMGLNNYTTGQIYTITLIFSLTEYS